jgi:hypothetical protein
VQGARASWKIIATSLPRMRRRFASDSPMISVPSTRMDPVICVREASCSPRIAMLETDLPEPDSPTMPNVWPSSTV